MCDSKGKKSMPKNNSLYCMTPDHCVKHNCFHEGLSVFAFSCETSWSRISVTESSCKIPDSQSYFYRRLKTNYFCLDSN